MHHLHYLADFLKGLSASVAIHFTAVGAVVTVEWASHQLGHVVGIILLRLGEG